MQKYRNISYSGHQNNINNTTTSIHQCLWELLHGNTTNPGVHLPRCTPGRQNINNIATWIHILPFQVPIQVYTYSTLLLLILLAEFGAGIAALVPSLFLLLFLIYSYDNCRSGTLFAVISNIFPWQHTMLPCVAIIQNIAWTKKVDLEFAF